MKTKPNTIYMSGTTIENKPYITMEITEEYVDFRSFYETNKHKIYKNIVRLYDELSKTKKEKLKISIFSTVSELPWEGSLEFYGDNHQPLMDVLLPHFEEKEEYEVCSDIIKIYNRLQ